MNAKQIRPFLFWIICGVILLIELTVSVFLYPALPEDKLADAGDIELTPAAAKQKLDEVVDGPLNTLRKQAQETLKYGNGVLPSVRAEDAKALERYLKSYLIYGDQWKGGLQRHIEDYAEQEKNIRALLLENAKPLRVAVSLAPSDGQWNDDYKKNSAAILRRLFQAGCLLPGSQPPTDEELSEQSNWRDVVGFRSGGQIPTASERGELTLRYNLVRIVADEILIAAQGAALVNPCFPTNDDIARVPPPNKGGDRAVLKFFKIERTDGSLIPDALVHRLSLSLVGTVSALQAAVTAIDNLRAPLMVRTRAHWQRTDQPSWWRLPDGPMDLDLSIAVIEYKPGRK